jgi:hypothetical protein
MTMQLTLLTIAGALTGATLALTGIGYAQGIVTGAEALATLAALGAGWAIVTITEG